MHDSGLLSLLSRVEGLEDVESDKGIVVELGADQSSQAATFMKGLALHSIIIKLISCQLI
jgi:hypothetical protein